MGTSGSSSDVTPEDVLVVFSELDEPSTPLTVGDVTERLDCREDVARRALEELADRGEVRVKRVNGSGRVWWRPGADDGAVQETASTEFSAFVSAVKDYAIFMLDTDGTVANWNDGAERIKGYHESDIVGEHFSTFYTEADVDDGVPEQNLDAATRNGRVEDEGWRVRKDGSRFWANVVITAVRDDDGELQGFTKVTRDMTERREYEQELREKRDLVEQILDTVPVGIGVLDAEGTFVRANQRLLERREIDRPALADSERPSPGASDADGDLLAAEEWPLARVVESGEPVHDFEYRIESQDGDHRWLSINAAPLDGEAEDGSRIVVAVDDITDRKGREQQLERRKTELETELSEILGRISDAFYALDDEWRLTHLNERAADIMQRPRDELLGQVIWDVVPDQSGIYREHFERAMASQEPATFEVYAEGHDAWLEFNVYPSESGLSIYFRDVTERKQRERELAKYETIVETVEDGIYVKDEDGRFTMVNEAYAELTGYDREELVGANASLVVDEATIQEAKKRKKALSDDDTDPTMEAMIERADGDRVPTEGTFATIETGDGETEQVGVVRDISDRKEYERKIEESERRYRTLAENFPNGIVALFDEDLRYVAAGGELVGELGIEREDVVGETIHDRYPDDLLAEVEPYFEAALDGEANSFEVTAYDRHLRAHTLPIKSTGGDRRGMLVVQDITERKEYERQLEASNERLQQFAYAASHDLQEPLRMVSSYLQLVEDRYGDELDADGREFIDFAVDGAERMRAMIEGLLEYSRVETRGDPFEPVDLDAVLADVREDLQLQIRESDAEISVESLPVVHGDADQLRQVFQNLLDNAIEYSGDEPPRIEIDAERDGDQWVLSVSDEGIGVDPEDEDRIFEVFQRLHSHEDHSGTGIGLALCRRIVDRHGGEIWVESDTGAGATFLFTLPADEAGDE
ncbi:PAS domain S-box protein [Halosimplex amylolyticum]|uniref:PAS domain-containing sensor histidine kinase n=1 Tax=Halosimplex amylolyticum TaxID=3396616 RepID=UPI003F566DFE